MTERSDPPLPRTLDSAIHGHPFAAGRPDAGGRVRITPEDFEVRELPLVEPAGVGEHAWLWIRKSGENTEDVARRLAQVAGVQPREVSYAGMKDRHAVTEQWFSVHLPGRLDPDWSAVNAEGIDVLRWMRHTRKLRRGALRGNAFRIHVREVTGARDGIEARLQRIAGEGVPNYFGPQRFGRAAANLETAERLFTGTAGRLSRHHRGLALSAARAYLFNLVLARRVGDATWNRVLPGDALQLSGSHSFFLAEAVDAELEERVRTMDVHPTGPLIGAGETPVTGVVRELEAECLAGEADWCAGLASAWLRQERRALRLPVAALAWSWPEADCLELAFELPAGTFATSVLRELLVESG
jgi:tRNA pseudouridine13 synthase